MAIQFIGSAVGVDTATLPAHRAGDLIVVFAYSDATTTVPALVTGYTNAPNNAAGGNSNAHRVAYKLATSSAEAVGTWTGATQLAVAVYRGVDQTTPIGAGAAMTGITDVTYPALTLQGPPSWVFAAHGRRTGNQENVAVPPPARSCEAIRGRAARAGSSSSTPIRPSRPGRRRRRAATTPSATAPPRSSCAPQRRPRSARAR